MFVHINSIYEEALCSREQVLVLPLSRLFLPLDYIFRVCTECLLTLLVLYEYSEVKASQLLILAKYSEFRLVNLALMQFAKQLIHFSCWLDRMQKVMARRGQPDERKCLQNLEKQT